MTSQPTGQPADAPHADLTPEPEVYLVAALAQQQAWRPDEDPDYQRHIAERMAADQPFRVAVEAAYQAGREVAAQEAVALLADLVAKCTEYGSQDDGFVAYYLLPTGPVHRAIPWLQQRGITVRPGQPSGASGPAANT